MPTVILLDNSLSMLKTINETTKLEQAKILIRSIIDNFSKYDKFEYLALVTYSSTAQVVSEFTRDYSKIEENLENLQIGDSSCLEEGLNKVSDLVIDDNLDSLSYNSSIRYMCLRLKENRALLKEYYLSNGIDFDEKIHMNSILNEDILKSQFYLNLNKKNAYYMCKYPFSFPNRFDIVCLDETGDASETDQIYYGFDEDNFKLKNSSYKNTTKKFYLKELIQLNNSASGSLYSSKSLKADYFKNEFCTKILNDLFNPFNCKLKCGHLESTVSLIPAPIPFKGYQNYCYVEKEIWRSFEICGFISIAYLSTPPTISRHLIVLTSPEKKVLSLTGSDEEEIISFAILLHSSLKAENMAAIVQVGKEWFGAVQLWNESKNDPKKNLMLTLYGPGNDVLLNIINKANNKTPAAGGAANAATNQLPLFKSTHVKSYSKGCIVWYRQDNLVSDLQKIVRNAKKMQEKMPVFYKELNRVRKAALSFGFYDLFEGIAQMLQRELNNMSSSNNPETQLQLHHSINCLRQPEFKDFRKDIVPFVANLNAPFTRKINK